MRFKIEHVRKECIGCGSCVSVCGGFWVMNKDGKSDLKKAKNVGSNQVLELNDLKCNMEAAEICPVNCIHIYENGKKKV